MNGLLDPKARILINLNQSGLETEFTRPSINAHFYSPTFIELNQLG